MNRLFPIMPPDRHNERQHLIARGVRIIDGVNWDMMEEHEAQAETNHDQSLRVLAERCGLSACEAVAILENRPWRMMPLDEAFRRLGEIERQWLKQRETA